MKILILVEDHLHTKHRMEVGGDFHVLEDLIAAGYPILDIKGDTFEVSDNDRY